MSTTTTNRGYSKAVGADIARDYLKTTLAATLDLADADVQAALWGHRNLLTNPGLEVNQRGGTVTANNAYAHDRWQHQLGGTSTGTITDETTIVDAGSGHALKWVYVHGSAVSRIDQKLEDYLQLRGRTVAFAIRVRKGVASTVRPYINDSGSRTYGSATTTTGAYETLSVTLAIGSGATSVSVGVEASASDTVYLDNATLGLGSVVLPYAPLHSAEDLTRCQRYYRVYGTGSTALAMVMRASASGAHSVGIYVILPIPPGGTPTVTKNGTWNVTNCNQPGVFNVSPVGFDLAVTATGAGAVLAYCDSSDDSVTVEWNP